MSKLTGKVVIVTGASKGIGAGIARAYGEAGATVVVNYATSKEGADKIVAEIVSKGGKAISVQADLSKAADISRLFAETKKAYGKLDVLVNNAGYYDFGPFDSVTAEGFHRHFDTNVLGPILATQEAVKLFGEEGGSIVNISSIVAIEPPPYTLVYSATKAAVDNITSTLSKELGPKKIRVNAILPGMTLTEGAARIGVAESEMGASMLARTPLGRHGQPEDIASVALFLGSPESNWITGETIRVSGGLR